MDTQTLSMSTMIWLLANVAQNNSGRPLTMRRERRYDEEELLMGSSSSNDMALALHTYIIFHFVSFTPGKHTSAYIVEGAGRPFEHISKFNAFLQIFRELEPFNGISYGYKFSKSVLFTAC